MTLLSKNLVQNANVQLLRAEQLLGRQARPYPRAQYLALAPRQSLGLVDRTWGSTEGRSETSEPAPELSAGNGETEARREWVSGGAGSGPWAPEHLFDGPGFGHPAPRSRGDHIWGPGCPKASWEGEGGHGDSSGFLHPRGVVCAGSSVQEVLPGPVPLECGPPWWG